MISPLDLLYKLKSLLGLVDKKADTTGPASDEHPLVAPLTPAQSVVHKALGFQNGIYDGADPKPANPGRVGGAIKPSCIVVHTTDMVGAEEDLIRAWQTTITSGACAHFLIHRTGKVTQFVPINRNGNHAGGPVHGHGNYRVPGGNGTLIHPNVVSVGIEIHSGGLLAKSSKGWLHKDSGRLIPEADVFIDAKGRGWQKVTEEQLKALDWLLQDLKGVLAPGRLEVVPDGKYSDNAVAYYAELVTGRIAGHVTLDPVNKTDPGPQVMQWLKDNNYGV